MRLLACSALLHKLPFHVLVLVLSSRAADVAWMTDARLDVAAYMVPKSAGLEEACLEMQIALVPCSRHVTQMMLTCNKVFWLP